MQFTIIIWNIHGPSCLVLICMKPFSRNSIDAILNLKAGRSWLGFVAAYSRHRRRRPPPPPPAPPPPPPPRNHHHHRRRRRPPPHRHLHRQCNTHVQCLPRRHHHHHHHHHRHHHHPHHHDHDHNFTELENVSACRCTDCSKVRS